MRIISGGSLGDDVALTGALLAFKRAHPHERVSLTVRQADVFAGIYLDGERDDGSVVQLGLGGDLKQHLARNYGDQLGVRVWDTTPRIELTPEERNAASWLWPGGGEAIAVDTWAGWPSRRYVHWDAALRLLKERWLENGRKLSVIEVGATVPDCFGATRGASRLESADVSYVDTLSMRGTAALISHCRVYVGSDSGLAHVAAAVGTRNVVLYGPKPWWTRAYESTYPVTEQHPCRSHCTERSDHGYHGRDGSCVDGIEPETIADACAAALLRAGAEQ